MSDIVVKTLGKLPEPKGSETLYAVVSWVGIIMKLSLPLGYSLHNVVRVWLQVTKVKLVGVLVILNDKLRMRLCNRKKSFVACRFQIQSDSPWASRVKGFE